MKTTHITRGTCGLLGWPSLSDFGHASISKRCIVRPLVQPDSVVVFVRHVDDYVHLRLFIITARQFKPRRFDGRLWLSRILCAVARATNVVIAFCGRPRMLRTYRK